MSEVSIRPAGQGDAETISRLVISTLRESNARDYSEAVIARVGQGFRPEAVRAFIDRRRVFVAVIGHEVVGTASLDGHVVRTVFVKPAFQGRGIGRALMDEIGRTAIRNGITTLAVPSSVTAEPFYASLGFRAVRDAWRGDERTIVMERILRERRLPGRDPDR
ncbi:GNAT family N-acetyltransferase [Azospirillum picis]|uniref:GNAT superfamily N-acetyltransferase n=1 Tax=Azospirillum picis TaxID=488438 RepID=A0ABU0MQS4_9PROT|nr:GNAT family N-acetyltransferase [Azospirillum picis]MBP2302236.1 GNAT superfamily N-acetyltransferase [Azospirillum picis]MDQ0535815.1 GNAT superfamily N-acetyltransferase [Azospirillum picis]